MADEFKIVASLNIPESASRINKDIPKLQGQSKHLKIIADLDPKLSIKNIQATLNKMNNNANIKIGVDTSGLNSVQSATQNITNSLQTVQTQAQQTANAVRDIGNVGISDNVFKKLLQDMQISKKVTDDYKQSLRTLANELTTAWDTRNEELYLAKLKEIINLIDKGQQSFKLFDKNNFGFNEITSQIAELKSAIGIYSEDSFGKRPKYFIDDNLKKELAYIQGSDKAVRSLLNSLYGVGNWTFNKRNFGFVDLRNQIDKAKASLDSLYSKFSDANFGSGNIANFITETYKKINTLKESLKTKDTLNGIMQSEMGIENANKQLEIMIANALKLKDFTSRSNDPLGWFEEIITESEKVNSSLNSIQRESRETSIALGEIGHNFISNNQVQATFSSLKQAEEYFKGLNLGQVSLNLNKGSLQGLKDFTITVKSATGEVEKFSYAVHNIGDDQNPIPEYVLQNINAANAGVKKLQDDIEKAKANAQKTLASFDNKSMGLFSKTDVYKKTSEALKDITDFDSISKFNTAMAELEAHYQKITAYTRSGSKSLNPFINAVNDMAGMEEQIKRIKASADGLQNKSKSLIGNLGSLNRLADNVNKHAVGTEEWGQAYEKLKNKIAQVNDQIKTAKVEQKTTDSFAQKQQNIYSVIEQRMKQINQLKIQQLSTDESTSRIIQEQINSYTNQINGIKGNMSKYKYGDKTLDNEVEKLKVELDYKYRIAQSEKENRVQQQSNNELLKFQTDTLREINAEYEKIVANKKAMASTKSEENKSIYANRIAESEKIIANDMEMLKDANLLTEEINQQVASKRQYVSEQEKIIANTEQLKREQELNQVFKSQITEVEKYKNSINETIDTLQRLQNSSTFTKNASNPQVAEEKNKISALIAEYQKLITQLNGNVTPAGLEDINNRLNELNARFNTTTATAQRFESELKNDNGAEKLAQKVALLKAQLTALEKANPKAMIKFGNKINSLMATLNSNPDGRAVEQVAKSVQVLRREINNADLAGKTFFQNLKEKATKFTGWMSMTYAISLATRTIRSMITEVVNLDTALIDLKKTFKGTNSDLQDFYYEANNVAKQLGVTTEEVINSASSWSRLGYNTKQTAVEMAKAASIMKMISPNMDIDTANSGLVSIVKAFDEIDVGNILNEVISPINEVGNNFAVSNNDILEGLQRSSAAMKMMGEDLTSTIALFTAGKFCCLYVQKCA